MEHNCIQHQSCCKHEKIKFCTHCSKVYCVDCGKEWNEPCTLNHYYYNPYTSTPYYGTPCQTQVLGNINLVPTITGVDSVGQTCTHTVN